MNINGIEKLFASVISPVPLERPEIDGATEQHFANLLKEPLESEQPENLLQVQKCLNSFAVGTDLTAKVAGLTTQGINKLVNMS